MWYKRIELSEYESARLRDIFDALTCSLMRLEVEEFAYELLGTLGMRKSLLEACDYVRDV